MGKASRERRRAAERAVEQPVEAVVDQARMGRPGSRGGRGPRSKHEAMSELRMTVHRLELETRKKDARVTEARRLGATWTEIGAVLGVSAQAVQKRYGVRSGAGTR